MITEVVSRKSARDINKYAWLKYISNLEPENKMFKRWEEVQMFIVLVTVVYAPFKSSFWSNVTSNQLFLLETVIDILLFIDIFIMFLIPYYRPDGTKEYDFKKIAINYCSGYFIFDLLSIYPSQFIELATNDLSIVAIAYSSNSSKATAVRFMRTLKILKFGKYNE